MFKDGVLSISPVTLGVLKYGMGHYYMVGSTPTLPAETIPEDILKKHIGNLVVVLSASGTRENTGGQLKGK